MIGGLLFDLDGVLVDTAKYHYLAWKQIADMLKIPFSEKENERLKGISREESFEILLSLNNCQLSPQEKEVYCEKKNKLYKAYLEQLQAEEVLPGVRSFLQEASMNGYRIGLGSASKNSLYILEKLNLLPWFHVIIDGTKVTQAKPNPEVFQRGAKALGLPSNECLVFEDSEAGIEAAHRAGMKAVGIGSREKLPEADMILRGFQGTSLKEVIDVINIPIGDG